MHCSPQDRRLELRRPRPAGFAAESTVHRCAQLDSPTEAGRSTNLSAKSTPAVSIQVSNHNKKLRSSLLLFVSRIWTVQISAGSRRTAGCSGTKGSSSIHSNLTIARPCNRPASISTLCKRMVNAEKMLNLEIFVPIKLALQPGSSIGKIYFIEFAVMVIVRQLTV